MRSVIIPPWGSTSRDFISDCYREEAIDSPTNLDRYCRRGTLPVPLSHARPHSRSEDARIRGDETRCKDSTGNSLSYENTADGTNDCRSIEMISSQRGSDYGATVIPFVTRRTSILVRRSRSLRETSPECDLAHSSRFPAS